MTSPDSKNVTITFNGQTMSVPQGSTVMEAAAKAEIPIPHFCWHPGLKVAGVCRFCLVKVEGARKLEIACNLPVREGMVVDSVDPEVKEAHKWALEFHLVNHPLDCPICDQAGECKLQDFYMDVGKYQSQVHRPKVLKPKALEVGRDLVLDTERCILCDRCVRFEEDVTKTGALGIFDRGDRAIVGTYPGKSLDHNYTTNLVDICPVGAFTSKDFRFKQRVWFLEDKASTCPGCATGCAVTVSAKTATRKFFRLKPRHSEVNSYWMCNSGRHTYEHLNKEHRLLSHYTIKEGEKLRSKCEASEAVLGLARDLLSVQPAEDVSLLVSAQFTNEEYEDLLSFFTGELGVKKVYQWRDAQESPDEFDGLLERGDKNSNTAGLLAALEKQGLKRERGNELAAFLEQPTKLSLVLAPELISFFSSFEQDLSKIAQRSGVTLVTLSNLAMSQPFARLIATKGFAEKRGTFTGFDQKPRALEEAFPPVVKGAMDLSEFVGHLRLALSEMRSTKTLPSDEAEQRIETALA